MFCGKPDTLTELFELLVVEVHLDRKDIVLYDHWVECLVVFHQSVQEAVKHTLLFDALHIFHDHSKMGILSGRGQLPWLQNFIRTRLLLG
jgi:hypothetical protein